MLRIASRGLTSQIVQAALFQKAAQALFRPRETDCFEGGQVRRKSEVPPIKTTAPLKWVFYFCHFPPKLPLWIMSGFSSNNCGQPFSNFPITNFLQDFTIENV
jgi:hypothetical protein